MLCNVGTARPGRLATQVADLYLADVLEPLPDAGGHPDTASAPGDEPSEIEVSMRQLERFATTYWRQEDRTFRATSVAESAGGARPRSAPALS